MNRRAFLVSSFILGLNAAMGNRIKPVGPDLPAEAAKGWTFTGGTNDYMAKVGFFVFNHAHTPEQQDMTVQWIRNGAQGDCPVPGLVIRA